MKKLLLALIVSCLPSLALANVCSTVPAVCNPGPCNSSSAASWQGCGGTTPQPGDSVLTNGGGDVLNLNSNLSLVSFRINTGDTLQCSGTTPRTITLSDTTTLAFNNTGTLKLCNGFRLNFTGTSTILGATNAGVIDSSFVDLGPLYTITAFTSTASSGVCISGDRWTIGTANPVSNVAAGDLVQFLSGIARGRMYEIVGLSGTNMTLCPSFPDGSSLGPRLTPHLTRLAVDVANGVYPTIVPAVNDTFIAWRPWKISASPSHFRMIDANQSNLVQLVGGEIANPGDDFGSSSFQFDCNADRPPVVFSHMHMHDGVGGVATSDGAADNEGCNKPMLTWNLMNDNSIADGNAQIFVGRNEGAASPTVGGLIALNTIYRSAHNFINVNQAASTKNIVGIEVSYNTAFEADITNSGENEYIEIDASDTITIQSNIGYKLGNAVGGILCNAGLNPTGITHHNIRWNFMQGALYGISYKLTDLLGPDTYCTGNYIANTFRSGILCWRTQNNIVRDWCEGNAADGPNYPVAAIESYNAQGNWMDGAGSARANTGILVPTGVTGGAASYDRVARNNVCRNLTMVAGGLGSDVCVQANFTTAADTFNMTVKHNVMDCGSGANCAGIIFVQSWSPTAAQTLVVADNVVLGTNAASVASTTFGGANLTDSITNLTRFGGISAASGTWSSKLGEVVQNPLFFNSASNLNLQPTSPVLGAGSNPVGSSIGLRSFYFPEEYYPSGLRTIMVIPEDVATEVVNDFDMDGFLTFSHADADSLDKCPWIPDIRNGADNAGVCLNLAAGAAKALNKGAN